MAKSKRLKKEREAGTRKVSIKPTVKDRDYVPYPKRSKRSRTSKLQFLGNIMYPAHMQGPKSVAMGNIRYDYKQLVRSHLFLHRGQWKQRKDLPKRFRAVPIDEIYSDKQIKGHKFGRLKTIGHIK